MPNQISALESILDQGCAYRTVPGTRDITGARRRRLDEGAHLITFTSSSAVENFLALELPWPEGLRIASIDRVTSKTCRGPGRDGGVGVERPRIQGVAGGWPHAGAAEGAGIVGQGRLPAGQRGAAAARIGLRRGMR